MQYLCELLELDFEKGTVTFQMPQDSSWTAGMYLIAGRDAVEQTKLVSDEMVDVVAEGMFPPLTSLGDEDLEKARKYAKMALESIAGEI